MKKRIVTLIIALMLTFALTNGIFADELLSDHYEYAVNLNTLRLFKGTDIGFELEREPTRLEGAVMFVRLLGGEEEALRQEYSHPFTDVPQWASPYVGFLYKHELTNGIAATQFGSSLHIKAISYMTFVLRALGYDDNGSNGDFTWENSLEFADENGFINYELYSKLKTEIFLRGHVAWVSFEILMVDKKNGSGTLIENLIADGAVDRAAAENLGLLSSVASNIINISIGQSHDYVMTVLGDPGQRIYSRYGFYWMVYDSDMANYIQIGIENDTVVAIVTASDGVGLEKKVSVGMNRQILEGIYQAPLTELRKPVTGENKVIIYALDNTSKNTYINENGDYITYYFDSYENYKITAVMIIDDVVEERTMESFIIFTDSTFRASLEMQVFGLTNAIRVQKGFEALRWEAMAWSAASLHSKDMADRDFFSHYNPEGEGLGDRFNNRGINYVSAGENIAFGYRDSIHMVNDWLNSQTGHRDILLGDFDYIGVGIWINDENQMFATQDYWR